MKRVYLSGPIRGLNYKECNGWREYAKRELEKEGIIGVSLMRAKEYLNTGQAIFDANENVISTQKGITTRDRWDVLSCDVLLGNLVGAERVSIGTVLEYG